MAMVWRTLLLLVMCSVTLVSSRGHHRHRHGFQHLKKHLHRLHLKHMKTKFLSTVMPTTSGTKFVTELRQTPEASTVKPEFKTSGQVVPTEPPYPRDIAEAEMGLDSDEDMFGSEPELLKNMNPEKPMKKTHTGISNWAKRLAEERKQEKWISYDELKKKFRYDDTSTLPILDVEPVYESDLDSVGPQKKGFRPVALPKRFVSYDKNKDGFISKKELQKVTGAVENSDQAFKDTDKNGDGYISPSEFMRAPWQLEDDPDHSSMPVKTSSFLTTRRMKVLDGKSSPEDEGDDGFAGAWYPLKED